jgi:hypothetical protein
MQISYYKKNSVRYFRQRKILLGAVKNIMGIVVHLSSNGDDERANSLLGAIRRLGLWPVQVTGRNKISVSPPKVEKIRSYEIFITNVKDSQKCCIPVLHGTAVECF